VAGRGVAAVTQAGAVLAVVTRNRAALFERYLLASLVQAASDGVPIVVVDQSDGPETRHLVARVPGARYVRSGPGLSRGRNAAVAATDEPVIVFTDDDVSFPPGWVERIAAVFEGAPDAGAVCGRAVSGDGELQPGAAAGVYRHGVSPFGLGSGFNVAFRRAALAAAGPFDESLGAGARYRAGEDTDMLYRVMRAGWSVVCSDDVTVVHHDWRSPREQLRLSFSYGLGAGAQTAKHVALADGVAGAIALREAGRHVRWLVRKVATLVAKEVALQACFLAGLAVGFVQRRRELAAAGAGPGDEAGVARDHGRRDVDEPSGAAAGDEGGGGLV
jgi:GT2 family glycosyltransferase